MQPVAIGLSVRDPWVAELLEAPKDCVDVLEVMIDDALSPCDHGTERRRAWRRLGSRWPLVAHGVDLGIGDAGGVDPVFLVRLGAALRELHVRWYSEHLSFLRADETSLGHFAPLCLDADDLAVLAENAQQVQDRVAAPLLLENPADVLGLGAEAGGEELGKAYAAALEATGAGALLDLTNLAIGARNDGFDAREFLSALPLERVVQVHLAGGRKIGDLWIDSHDRPIDDDALTLLEDVAREASQLRAVTLEWDEDLPSLTEALAELHRAEGVLRRAGRR